MTEDEAWDELERKQQKKPKPITEREALKIAYNALVEIDRETPYPLAKHAAMVINSVLNVSATDWEAIAADQAMTITMSRIDNDDIQEYKKPWVSLTDEEIDYIWGVTPPDYENFFEFPRAIEAALRSKNT
jgi:hypothetical protein